MQMRQASVFDYQLLYWFSAWDNALQNTPASAFSPFSSRPFPLPLPYALGPFSSSPFLFLFAFVRLCKSKGALFCLKEHCSVCTVLCHLLVSVNGRCGGVVFSFFFRGGGYWFPLICWYAHISLWGLRVCRWAWYSSPAAHCGSLEGS